MSTIRKSTVAGLFYPEDPGELEEAVRGVLQPALEKASPDLPRALIAPHAGYVYSGPVAASAYAEIWKIRDSIRRVVLLGPSHHVPLEGLAASSAEAFSTPLGRVLLDRAFQERALSFPQVEILDAAHAQEHSLEVHLPFLQLILDRFALVPLVVGTASAEAVSQVLEALWEGTETLVVVSSDLSHHLDYDTARRRDLATSAAIERLDPDGIGPEDACGRYPIRGLLLSARRSGLRARTLDLRSSGDTAGSRDQVVGYGAYVLH